MPTYEFIGRYAEDPNVYVEAVNAEMALLIAAQNKLPVSAGYEVGNLVPIEQPQD